MKKSTEVVAISIVAVLLACTIGALVYVKSQSKAAPSLAAYVASVVGPGTYTVNTQNGEEAYQANGSATGIFTTKHEIAIILTPSNDDWAQKLIEDLTGINSQAWAWIRAQELAEITSGYPAVFGNVLVALHFDTTAGVWVLVIER